MGPYILSIETASSACSVALHQAGALVASFEHETLRAHSDMLRNMAEAALQVAGLGIKDLAAIAVSDGPGSYTGLRLGAAFAKGICYAAQAPLLPINTLRTLLAGLAGYPLPAGALCYGLLDARRGYAYGLLADQEGHIVRDTHVCDLSSIEKQLMPGTRIYFMGSGADAYAAYIKGQPFCEVIRGVYPQASAMGELAHKQLQAGEVAALATYAPRYISALSYAARSGQASDQAAS